LPEDDYLTELHQLQMAFTVEMYDGKRRERKLESNRWEKSVVYFYFYNSSLCPDGLRKTV